jgi:putative transposase
LRIITQEAINHILRFATENPDWGYSRIVGALKKISITISNPTVKAVLTQNGILPPPGGSKRRTRSDGAWKKFIAAHMETTVAMDYFSSKLVTLRGVVQA